MRLHRLHALLVPALALAVIGAAPETAAAQRRVRPVVRPRGVVRGGVYRPVYVDSWYRYGWGLGLGYGYGWYPYQFGYPYPYPYGAYGYGYAQYDRTAEIRLEVTPRAAQVYVDGFLAGTVDDFDGFFQRLRVSPGEHDVVLYLDGYRTVHQQLYLGPGSDQKIRYTMVPLPAGEQPEPRPQPPAVAPGQPGTPPMALPPGPPRRGGPGRGGPPAPSPAPGVEAGSEFGSVAIRVQPADADVVIDGERWTGPAGQDRLVVQLSQGRHHVEVRKDGYEPYSSDVDVVAGDTLTLNVSLPRR